MKRSDALAICGLIAFLLFGVSGALSSAFECAPLPSHEGCSVDEASPLFAAGLVSLLGCVVFSLSCVVAKVLEDGVPAMKALTADEMRQADEVWTYVVGLVGEKRAKRLLAEELRRRGRR